MKELPRNYQWTSVMTGLRDETSYLGNGWTWDQLSYPIPKRKSPWSCISYPLVLKHGFLENQPIEFDDFPSYKPSFIEDLPASHVWLPKGNSLPKRYLGPVEPSLRTATPPICSAKASQVSMERPAQSQASGRPWNQNWEIWPGTKVLFAHFCCFWIASHGFAQILESQHFVFFSSSW